MSYALKENAPKDKSAKTMINWALQTSAGKKGAWDAEKCSRSCERLGNVIYVDWMSVWLEHFPRDQFLVIRTQDLEKNGAEVMAEVDHHLYLPPHDYSEILKQVVNTKKVPDIYNVTVKEQLEAQKQEESENDPIPAETRRWLTQFYFPHTMRLEDLLQEEMRFDYSPIFS